MWGNKAVPQTEEEIVNPYLMLEIAKQRTAERHEAARRAGLTRALRIVMRQRDRARTLDELDVPAIPDYVDGTFRSETPAGSEHAGMAR